MRLSARMLLLAAAILIASGSRGRAEETTLLFSTANPPNAHLTVQIMHPWAERINAAGKGVIHIEVRDGYTLTGPQNFLTRVLDDVAQISWGNLSLVGGRFQRTGVVSLPFEAERAEDSSTALWRLYKSGILDADFPDIVPLYLVTFPQAGIHLAKPVAAFDTLNGLKIIAGSRIGSQIVEKLGGSPLSLTPPEIYEALQRGGADGVNIQWTAFQPFKLAEVTHFHLEAQLGSAAAAIFMAKKRYEALPAAARKIIDDNSGAAESRAFGAFWDKVDQEGRDDVRKLPGHQIVQLSPAQKEAWRQKIEPLVAAWTKSTPDGDKVLAAYRQQLAAVKAGHWSAAGAAAIGERPNFLFIITDQQRADHLGCYGNRVVRTPAIDGLAAAGNRFERFYVANPSCQPNRASIMTGRMPSLHGVRHNGVPLAHEATTFVELLREAGYRTALLGKAHLQNFTGRPPVQRSHPSRVCSRRRRRCRMHRKRGATAPITRSRTS